MMRTVLTILVTAAATMMMPVPVHMLLTMLVSIMAGTVSTNLEGADTDGGGDALGSYKL